jgi:hypothetical protein
MAYLQPMEIILDISSAAYAYFDYLSTMFIHVLIRLCHDIDIWRGIY